MGHFTLFSGIELVGRFARFSGNVPEFAVGIVRRNNFAKVHQKMRKVLHSMFHWFLRKFISRFLRLGPWCCHCLRLRNASSGRRDTSPSSIATSSGMPSLRSLCLRPKQQPHLKVPAVLSNQVPGKRKTRSSLSSFSSKGTSACQRLLSVDVWRKFCRKSLARMVWMCMP